MIIIVSDLHLGDGGPLDDFLWWGDGPGGPGPLGRPAATSRLDAEFGRFLGERLAEADSRGPRPTLLLLGDTFDLWQAQRPGEPPARALERILSAHVGWVAAVRGWIGDGGAVQLVVGNHDQPLVDARAWGLLAEVLPGLNAATGGAWAHAFAHEASGLYAEHGNRWDPFNRVRNLARPDANPAGRRIVRSLVNRLEPAHPLIDKGRSLADTVRLAEEALPPEGLAEAFGAVERTLRGATSLARALAPWARREGADWRAVARRELDAMNRGLRRALSPAPGGTTAPLPGRLRFFASGHTHEAVSARTPGGVHRLNPGTWRPVAVRDAKGGTVVRQDLGWAAVEPDGEGGWRGRFETFTPGANASG